ncbi:E3 ubiquitin-protein ligase [Salix suchowensis]|nr:E3 ubiquitin-protein ligase [Salix suchowensis]
MSTQTATQTASRGQGNRAGNRGKGVADAVGVAAIAETHRRRTAGTKGLFKLFRPSLKRRRSCLWVKAKLPRMTMPPPFKRARNVLDLCGAGQILFCSTMQPQDLSCLRLTLKALYKKTECTFCKRLLNAITRTGSPNVPHLYGVPDALFSSFTSEAIPFKDSLLEIYFETEDMMQETLILLRFNCPDPDCSYIGAGWGDLSIHIRGVHKKNLCNVCVKNKKVFAHEHYLYTRNELAIHLPSMLSRHHSGKQPAKAQIEGGIHPLCEFCNECFFSDDELYAHLREHHEECFVCKRNGVVHQYRRREAFGGNLTGAAPANNNGKAPADRASTSSRSSVGEDDANRTPAYISRIKVLAANPANAVRAMKVATRSYASNECGARDLILTTWNVLDRDLERTSSVINAFVETLTDEEKKQDLLGKWKGFEIELTLFLLAKTRVPRIDSGGSWRRLRCDYLWSRHKRQASDCTRAQRSSRQVWDRVAQAASSSSSRQARPQVAQDRFPALGSSNAAANIAAPAPIPPFRQGQRNTPWSTNGGTSGSRPPSTTVVPRPSSQNVNSNTKRAPPPSYQKALSLVFLATTTGDKNTKSVGMCP